MTRSGRPGSVSESTMYWVRDADAPGGGTSKTRKRADGRPASGDWAEELGGEVGVETLVGAPHSEGGRGRGIPVPFQGGQTGQTRAQGDDARPPTPGK